jgi:hypothetical protein
VLKVDANPETGEGGDDGYDALRVAMASRPPRPIGQFFEGYPRAFSREALAFMVETLYKDTPGIEPHGHSDLYTALTGV